MCRRYVKEEAEKPGMVFAYLLLFTALYAGFGVQSPYLPRLLQEHGLAAETIGAVLAAGTAIRLAAGPLAGRIADRLDMARLVFAGCAALAAAAALGYLPAQGFWPLLGITLLQASTLAPLAPLGDSLVLTAAAPHERGNRPGFDYGWVRGAGSGAFILGSVVSGQAIDRYGLPAILWLNAGLLVVAAVLAPFVPRLPRPEPARSEAAMAGSGGIAALFRLPAFRRVVLAAALILGSHALHDSFAMIRWQAAGIDAGTGGILWSEAVAAEVVVFLFIGRPLLDRIGPNGAAMLAAAAGALRWVVEAETAWLPAVALIQPLHGVTFALLHVGCMQRLAETVPPRLAATALTVYGTLAIGAATALLTLASGSLYGAIGSHGFWVMAALCLASLPMARRL
jgi:MFS transporter, PPP family, 3-phenylpropionic acid transporter